MTATASLDLEAVVEAARRAWPTFAVEEAFAAHVAALLARDPDPAAALEHLHVADLYLAVACARGLREALDVLERVYMPDLRAILGRNGLTASAIDEVLQGVREELFVRRAEGPPRILNYGGRGALRGWLRSVATRAGYRSFRRAKPEDELDEAMHAAPSEDLELDYLKRTYGEAFQRAFRAALAALPVDDRVLLRQRFRHHMTVEELGRIHGVHAGTISRRVAAARERLATGTREAMVAALGIPSADVASILRLIQSQMDLTLSSLAEPA